jgi:molybdopterin-containing oxidoreductase family iron-sulfur binding subunit
MTATTPTTVTAAPAQANRKVRRFGMVINLDACTGCGACMMACAVENNCAPAKAKITDRTGITLMRVFPVHDRQPMPARRAGFVPMPCMQCEHPPCESVCPQQAVELDKLSGIVDQMPQRCFGCRYCMAACPYHARYFNWSDPEWPAGMEQTLNPAVAPRMRGVVEKCDFCHGRLHEAEDRAAHEGVDDYTYTPACVEACPVQAIVFGDLNDPESEASRLAKDPHTFRFLEKLGTEPKVYYHSAQPWKRALAERDAQLNAGKES